MATLRAVVEIEPWADEDDAPWPIEKAEPYRWEVLDGSTAPATIGTVMAALARWCRPEDAEEDFEPTAVEALRWIAEAEYLVLSAGIRAADAETAVNPGCCVDLENWRDWPNTWHGHPGPQIKHADDGLWIREDETSQSPVKIAAGALPGLMAGVREDLIAFLGAAERWAADLSADAGLAAAVIANVDRHVLVSAPLEQL
ncbi:hypothetical protein ABIA31_001901 [Catenulispora sp. MAP5-51]|uniref:hypothetical protein n=1 Tax=Catenulispora sp. MAP5-51 TaxID=3156298 RepID=UPI0035164536